MSIRNILVCYNGTDGAARAVRLASALARRYDAHLTGVFAHTVPVTQLQMEAYLTESALSLITESAAETEEQYETEFNEIVRTEEQGLRTTFLCEHGFPNWD